MRTHKGLQTFQKANRRALYQRVFVLGIIVLGFGLLLVGIAGTNSIYAITGFAILFFMVCADP